MDRARRLVADDKGGITWKQIYGWLQLYVKDITKDIKYTCYLANACDVFNFCFSFIGQWGAIPFIKQIV
jgi:hypothetical protein